MDEDGGLKRPTGQLATGYWPEKEAGALNRRLGLAHRSVRALARCQSPVDQLASSYDITPPHSAETPCRQMPCLLKETQPLDSDSGLSQHRIELRANSPKGEDAKLPV